MEAVRPDPIQAVLADLAALPYADRLRVFGSVARGAANPKDVDVFIDIRGTKADVSALRKIAHRLYGYLDPFVMTSKGLYTRNASATGWEKVRHPEQILASIDKDGAPLSQVLPDAISEAKYDYADGYSYDTSDPVVMKYMEGACYALAVAHHRRFGWPLYVMGANEADGPVDELDFFHGMVKHPTGALIDISGPHEAAELMQAWGEPLAAITEQQLLRSLNDYMRGQTLNGLPEANKVIESYMMKKYPELYR